MEGAMIADGAIVLVNVPSQVQLSLSSKLLESFSLMELLRRPSQCTIAEKHLDVGEGKLP
jgi:hypothetical protein